MAALSADGRPHIDQVPFGRFTPSFGDFPVRHDPANHRTNDKPLPYDMGRMLHIRDRAFAGLFDRTIADIPTTVEKQRYMTSVAPMAANPLCDRYPRCPPTNCPYR